MDEEKFYDGVVDYLVDDYDVTRSSAITAVENAKKSGDIDLEDDDEITPSDVAEIVYTNSNYWE